MPPTRKVKTSFGARIKLHVPNFEKINQHYETLKKTVTLKKSRPSTKLKPSGRSRQTLQTAQTIETDENEEMKTLDHSKHTASTRVLYTANNQRLIKTPGKQIQNPWIEKAIHEETLEKKKTAARVIQTSAGTRSHTNLMSHARVIKDNTFIHKHEPSRTDEQTQEALKLFEKENEIFTVEDLPPTTFLPRFDLKAYDEEEQIPKILAR